MKPYSELELMAPEMYLNPENFKTIFDKANSEYGVQQYNDGLKYGNEFDEIHISERGTWSGSNLNYGKSMSTCEGIGYHSETSAVLRGLLDSSAAIIVHRKFLDKPVTIKESTKSVIAA